MELKLLLGDCIEQLKTLEDNSIDSIVTDPPAGISFMGKDWDDDKGGSKQWIKWLSEVFIEARRVLKPGGHALVWSLPRTSHWTGTALEDAGFEVRDCIAHVFGSGFPKSCNISKQLDKMAGADRKVIGKESLITEPSTNEAKEWDGWGTALKPAVENWWLIRKPLSEKTVAKTVLKWGTGGINIDGCRISNVGRKTHKNAGIIQSSKHTGGGMTGGINKMEVDNPIGRFPANLIHDGSDEVEQLFLKQGGTSKGSGKKRITDRNRCDSSFKLSSSKNVAMVDNYNDSGTPSRFFYCAKPSKAEKELGLEGTKQTHPTVKAQKLMQYLITLITPPGGTVLDMFMGSGSTGVAAVNLGFNFVGIEREQEYMEIAKRRIDYAEEHYVKGLKMADIAEEPIKTLWNSL